MKLKLLFLLAILYVGYAFDIVAQTDNGYKLDQPNYKYGRFISIPSKQMQSDFPVLVFTPSGYEKSKTTWPVVYLLHGVNNMPINEEGLRKMYNPSTRMQEMADMFRVIIVAPLVGNHFYLDSPLKKEIKIATFIATELTAFVDSMYRTQKSRGGRILAGFSMGGYGAVSLLCRYPDIFSVALARAGALNPATFIEDLKWDNVGFGLSESLGNYFENSENYHRNNCFNLVNHVRNRKDIAFVLEVGKEDFLYKTNYQFHLWLNELKVPHIYTETEGGHAWNANALRNLLSNLQYFKQTQFE